MRLSSLIFLVLAFAGQLSSWADSGRPVEKKTYWSANRQYVLTVDPRWLTDGRQNNPLLTLADATGKILWNRGAEDFEDFEFPMHACFSDDGLFLVFGGNSVHNISFDDEYREGLRFYRSSGELLAFISRRDLPVGEYSVSTAHWYDSERTKIEGERLRFFTPGKGEPIEFEVSTGLVLEGALTPGQGDDENWKENFLRRVSEKDGT